MSREMNILVHDGRSHPIIPGRGTFFSRPDGRQHYSPIRVGEKFGRWMVLGVARYHGGGDGISWLCRCECGTVHRVGQSCLLGGMSKSCGCLRRERKDLSISSGDRFGRLTVLRDLGTRGKQSRDWLCQCDCGALPRAVPQTSLKSGQTQSCGCLGAERRRAACTTHGHHKSPEYRIWYGMRGRCENPNEFAFRDYGGRGILICERWSQFENFLADMGHRPAGTSIERLDNDLGYEPDNCVWATKHQQSRNRRNNVIVEVRGVQMILVDAAKAIGYSPSTIRKFRILYNETHQQAVDRLLAARSV